LGQFLRAGGQRLAVEQPGQLIDHALIAVLDIRVNERYREHRGGKDQRRWREDQRGIVQERLGIAAEVDGEGQPESDDHAERNYPCGKAGGERHHRDRKPRYRRDRHARQRHAARNHRVGHRPRAEDRILRV
jgi:hypothetical protein